MRYLESLPADDDDDLVLIIDGYDVIMQLPPDVMIQRYFAVTEAANAKLAARFGQGSTAAAAERADGNASVPYLPHQSVLFGPDKLCWPVDFRRPACWAVPDTGLPGDAFGYGEVEDVNDIVHNPPRWLNSGTILGPVAAVRDVFAATLERIRTTYDPENIVKESDQLYMSNVWGDQEYARSVHELQMHAADNADGQDLVPSGGGGGDDRWLPALAPDQRTDYHIGLDYESALFQAWAGYDQFLDLLVYNGPDLSATVTRNVNNASEFAPYDIQLPADVASSVTRLLGSVSESHNVDPSDLLVRTPLGTNLVTRHVYALFHCTGEKDYLNELWGKIWFYPYAKSLLKATIDAIKAGAPISKDQIDGRLWRVAKPYLSDSAQGDDGIGAFGAWADLSGEWLGWEDLCAGHEDELFSEVNLA